MYYGWHLVQCCSTTNKGNTYMQWAAVRIQQEPRTIPPQSCVKAWVLFLGRTCNEACHGWVPGLVFLPPKILAATILGHSFPHTENSFSGEGEVIDTCSASSSVVGSVGVKAIRIWRILLQLSVWLVEGMEKGRVGSRKRDYEGSVPSSEQCVILQ